MATVHAGPAATNDFLGVVRGYADAMIERGRDNYGPQKSGLLLSALDRGTLSPLTVRPAAPGGVRRGDRPGRAWTAMNGANPQLDQNLFRILYTLTEITGEPRYAKVADEELTWFFQNAMSPKTSLLPWGEHLSWDTALDIPISGGDEMMHEFARPWVLWERCFALVPEASTKFALGLWEHQIADHKTGGFDRHGPYFEHGPVDGKDFPRHAGFYIGTWCYAWKNTTNKVFLEAIEVLLARFERKRRQKDGSEAGTIGPLDCHLAAEMVPDALAKRLLAFAQKEDELILPDLRKQLDAPTNAPPLWQAGYSAGTLGSSAMFCWARYLQTTNAAYRELIMRYADRYADSRPEENVDAWPMSFGHAISTQVAAYKLSRQAKYLTQAQRLARMAVAIFWQDNPLPRASMHTGHYETITGADTLALGLLEVHAATHGLTNRIPANTIDR
jgi:Periplasmic pectate lyase